MTSVPGRIESARFFRRSAIRNMKRYTCLWSRRIVASSIVREVGCVVVVVAPRAVNY